MLCTSALPPCGLLCGAVVCFSFVFSKALLMGLSACVAWWLAPLGGAGGFGSVTDLTGIGAHRGRTVWGEAGENGQLVRREDRR